MNLLFKLKKDGITVGYVKLFDYGFLYSAKGDFNLMTNEPKLPYEIEGEGLSYHPFVTKDKNGKDVFADDTIQIGEDGYIEYRGKIIFKEDSLAFELAIGVGGDGKLYPARINDIELIEETKE